MDFKHSKHEIEGEWFAPLSGQPVAAIAKLSDDSLHIIDQQGSLLSLGYLEHITFAPRIGNIARNITLPDGSEFITRDNHSVDALISGQGMKRQTWVHKLEEFHPRLGVLLLAIILLSVAIYRYAIPILVEVAIYVTPPVVTELMSQSTLQTLDKVVFSETTLSTQRQEELQASFALIAKASQSGVSKFTLNFRQGGQIGPNAFALPDGTLVLTDELVDLANGDDELLLGVLAHEIGHVEKEHSLRQLYRAAGVTGLIFLIGGDVGAGVEDAIVQGAGLVTLSYSREAEAEADRHSIELMHKIGKDPVAIARFFELIEKEFGDMGETSIFSTHPGTPERRKAAEEYAKSLR